LDQPETHSAQVRPLSLSKRLAAIVASEGPDRLTFTDLAAQLRSRSWGGLLLLFAAINVLPLPTHDRLGPDGAGTREPLVP
jgi:hypothetical protein